MAPPPESSGPPGGPLAIDDHNAPLYTVGQVAELLGVQPAFVRRLDTEHVVEPARSAGGQRRYSREDVGQVQAVSRMASEGMTLPGIKRILALEAQVERLQAQLERLQRKVAGTTRGGTR
ncbi:MAG: MerR family transcriptional regulator [Acidimicrobiales bacterium]